uniref:hypothetical protein n=1 Tax=Gonatophragmium mori TaxID=2966219 RepID=UPI0023D83067|nr:hypothetical protein P2Z26_mgp27 [Gonatophragmium mori]WCZ71153.1 hypothetical protein [Gonatophragmium mori]
MFIYSIVIPLPLDKHNKPLGYYVLNNTRYVLGKVKQSRTIQNIFIGIIILLITKLLFKLLFGINTVSLLIVDLNYITNVIYAIIFYFICKWIHFFIIINVYKDAKINKSYKNLFITCLFTIIILLLLNYLGFNEVLFYIFLRPIAGDVCFKYYDDFYLIFNNKSEEYYASVWTNVFGSPSPGILLPHYLPPIPKPWEIDQFYNIDKMNELCFAMAYEYNLRKVEIATSTDVEIPPSILSSKTILIKDDIRKSEILARVKQMEKIIREETDFGN